MLIRIECPDCGDRVHEINEEKYTKDKTRTAITIDCPYCGRNIWTGTNIATLKKTFSSRML